MFLDLQNGYSFSPLSNVTQNSIMPKFMYNTNTQVNKTPYSKF